MKRWFLVLSLAFNSSFCSPKRESINNSMTDKPENQNLASKRKLASVSNDSKYKPLPSSLVKFLNGKTQNVKLKNTLKQYSNTLPENIFKKLISLSGEVDDLGVTIKRDNSVLTLSNSKAELKILFTGSVAQLISNIEGMTYDFSSNSVTLLYLNELEKNLNKDLGALDVNKKMAAPSKLFLQCLTLPFLAMDSKALPMGWFVAGGLALLAVAIMVSVSKLGKDLKKTEHTVNHKVGLSDSSENAINSLTKAVKEVDPQLLSNNNINVYPDINIDGKNLNLKEDLGLGVE